MTNVVCVGVTNVVILVISVLLHGIRSDEASTNGVASFQSISWITTEIIFLVTAFDFDYSLRNPGCESCRQKRAASERLVYCGLLGGAVYSFLFLQCPHNWC